MKVEVYYHPLTTCSILVPYAISEFLYLLVVAAKCLNKKKKGLWLEYVLELRLGQECQLGGT